MSGCELARAAVFVEFGPVTAHAFYGFVKEFNRIAGTGSGRDRRQHPRSRGHAAHGATTRCEHSPMDRRVPECWVGLNDTASGVGLYAAPCNEDSTFDIPGVRPGTYQLVAWDRRLDTIISFFTVIVGNGEAVNMAGCRRTTLVRPARTLCVQRHERRRHSPSWTNPAYPIKPSICGSATAACMARRRPTLKAICHLMKSSRSSAGWWRRWTSRDSKRPASPITVDEGGGVSGNYDDPLDPAGGRRTPQIQFTGLHNDRVSAANGNRPGLAGRLQLLCRHVAQVRVGQAAVWRRRERRHHAASSTTRSRAPRMIRAMRRRKAGSPAFRVCQVNLYRSSAAGVIQDSERRRRNSAG